MGEKKESGFFSKIFGGKKSGSCCTVEFEEVPESGSDTKGDAANTLDTNEKNKGCGCHPSGD